MICSVAFRSPSHAWATWLDRQQDLHLVAASATAIQAALIELDSDDLDFARRLWASVDGTALLAAWDAQIVAMRDKTKWPASLHETVAATGPPPTVELGRTLSTRVFERDGYRCRYCGIPVFTQWQRGDIPRLITAFPDLTEHVVCRDGSLHGTGKSGALTNTDTAKWLWMTASADHVWPASLGGPTTMDNLVTACAGCNYGKADWTLAQLDVLDPGPHPEATVFIVPDQSPA